MTLQELRYLVALADHGHFGRAAEACFITQSTLSTQIKKLEDFLGVTLFDRSLKRVTPTPIGKEILQAARNIVEEAERIRELAKHAQNPMTRTLHLGVIPTLGPYYLPHALTLAHKKHPGLRLLLREEMTPQILEHLADGKLDAGLLALPVRDEALDVCGAGTAGREEVRATSLETLRQMVGMGLGLTLLPALAVDAAPRVSRKATFKAHPYQWPIIGWLYDLE